MRSASPSDRLERLPPQYFASLLAARRRRREADGGPPVLDLGRGNPEVGPPPHVVEALREAAARPDVHGYAPFRGLPRLREAIAARYRDRLRRRHRPRARGRDRARHEDGDRRARARRSPSAATRSCCPIPGYPDYPSGVALAGAELGLLPLDPAAGWAPDFDAAPPAAAAFLNYPSNPCAVCAPPGTFEAAVAYAERTGTAIVARRRVHRPRLRRPRAGELPRDARREGRRRRDVDDVEDVRHGRLADRLRRRQRRDRRAREPAGRPLARRHVRAAAGGGDRRARRARRTRSRSGARPTSGAATGSIAALPEPPVCEGSFYVWLRLPEGLTADRLLVEQRVAVAPGEGFGPSGAGWARLSLAVADDVLDAGIERLAPALAAAYA